MSRDKKEASGERNVFQAPDLIKYKPLQDTDINILKKLSTNLTKMGVINHSQSEETMQAEESFTVLLREAQRAAKTENETNPDFYDPAAEAIVRDREIQDGDLFDNPSLDGVDDYGRQMYEDTRNAVSITSFSADNTASKPSEAPEKSTFEMLKESFANNGASPFEEGVFQKSVDAKPFDHIDFSLVKSFADEPLEVGSTTGMAGKDEDEEMANYTQEMYAKILSKARIPNGGML